MGWELFSQYVRALKQVKPKYFIYENNKSMSKQIRESIDEAFGFEAVFINSSFVSAQNRQRLYWVGKMNEDGTYSKVNVEQPIDKGILLKDILDSGYIDMDKAYCLKHQAGNARDHFKKHHTNVAFENVKDTMRNLVGNNIDTRTCVVESVRVGDLPNKYGKINGSQTMRIYSIDGKSVNLVSGGGGLGGKTGLHALLVDEPLIIREATKRGEVNINIGECFDMTQPNSKTRRGRCMSEKSNCLMTSCQYYQYCAKLVYATPCEWDENGEPIKAISCVDGKIYTVYRVDNGQIFIKDKKYPIKLIDGHYIIRKLTVRECMRLQTVPEWYEFPVSDTQAYKMLGNGWTCDVITHIIKEILNEKQ